LGKEALFGLWPPGDATYNEAVLKAALADCRVQVIRSLSPQMIGEIQLLVTKFGVTLPRLNVCVGEEVKCPFP
jgi:hypothetical protein